MAGMGGAKRPEPVVPAASRLNAAPAVVSLSVPENGRPSRFVRTITIARRVRSSCLHHLDITGGSLQLAGPDSWEARMLERLGGSDTEACVEAAREIRALTHEQVASLIRMA